MSDNQTSGGITIHVGPAKLQMLQLAGAALSETPTESMLDDRIAELEDEIGALRRENAALREMLDLTFRIPNMTDAELAELIRNCRAALGTAAKEAQP